MSSKRPDAPSNQPVRRPVPKLDSKSKTEKAGKD